MSPPIAAFDVVDAFSAVSLPTQFHSRGCRRCVETIEDLISITAVGRSVLDAAVVDISSGMAVVLLVCGGDARVFGFFNRVRSHEGPPWRPDMVAAAEGEVTAAAARHFGSHRRLTPPGGWLGLFRIRRRVNVCVSSWSDIAKKSTTTTVNWSLPPSTNTGHHRVAVGVCVYVV